MEVKVAAEEVAAAVGERATWRGVRARLAPWCGLGLRCRRPLPVVFAGWWGSTAVSHKRSCIIIAAMLKTPLDMPAARPYVFGRSVPPALCGTFPGLEYVSTIDG